MDKEIFKKNYEELYDLSQDSSSIYHSKAFEERLKDNSLETYLDNPATFLRIQLESEAFKNDVLEIAQESANSTVYDSQKMLIRKKLDDFLASFSPVEQNAIMFNMILNARRLSGKPSDTFSDLRLSQKATSVLKGTLVDEIADLSLGMIDSVVNTSETISDNTDNEKQNHNHAFSNEAFACAAYLSSSTLRSNPCLCGIFAGGAELISEYGENNDTLEFIGNVLIGIASILALFLLTCFLLVIAGEYFGEILAEDVSSVTLESFTKNTVIPFFHDFEIAILNALGIGVIGILVTLFASSSENNEQIYTAIEASKISSDVCDVCNELSDDLQSDVLA